MDINHGSQQPAADVSSEKGHHGVKNRPTSVEF